MLKTYDEWRWTFSGEPSLRDAYEAGQRTMREAAVKAVKDVENHGKPYCRKWSAVCAKIVSKLGQQKKRWTVG